MKCLISFFPDGLLLVGCQDGRVRCYSAEDGSLRWASEDHDSPVFVSPQVLEVPPLSSVVPTLEEESGQDPLKAVLSLGTEGREARLTDLTSGRPVARLTGLPGTEPVFSTPVICCRGSTLVLARRDNGLYGCRLEGKDAQCCDNDDA